MNRDSRRNRSSSASATAARMSFPAHILIAVVAIIECLILISFTTYSWIESNSSLVIMNGRQSTVVEDIQENYVNVDIADTLNYQVDLQSSTPGTPAVIADLSKFFRYTKEYRYGKASSPDGKTFYFPKRNNTYPTAGGNNVFRVGDTTDYNTSYFYFDFIINNNVSPKDFYFNDLTDNGGTQKVFSVSDPSNYFVDKTYTTANNETLNKTEAIKRAMRVSITTSSITPETGAETAAETIIYSVTGATYAAQNGVNDADHTTLTNSQIKKLDDYGINKNSSLPYDQQKKLFTAAMNKQTRVSVRIWFEIMDPDFQRAFNITRDPNAAAFSEEDFNAIAGVAINVDLSFGNADNNFRPFYFDDYTYDTAAANSGKNMTLANTANENYKVWFHCVNPDNTSQTLDFELSRLNTVGGRTRWQADEVPMTVTNFLQGNDITSTQLSNCYFAYGDWSTKTISKQWALAEKPDPGMTTFVYSAYSQTKDGSGQWIGVGAWTDAMRYVCFKDHATASTTADYNDTATNYQFMAARAVEDGSNYHVFVNNEDHGTSYNDNFSASLTKKTAAMYYDTTDELFKTYVPLSWVSNGGSSGNLYFNYSYSGCFSRTDTNVRWFAIGATPREGTYTYTALGYEGNHTVESATGNSAVYYGGVGTWGEVERIYLSAELIDMDHAKEYRYFVGVNGTYGQNSGVTSYPMVPDATHMLYGAYIPKNLGVTTTDLSFYRFNNVCTGTNNNYNTAAVTWTTTARGANSINTFYPVSTAAGYWNVAVLVDGTYENLIYDTLTDDDNGDSTVNTSDQGILQYSTDGGANWTVLKNQAGTDIQRLDAYRWYVNYAVTVNDDVVTYPEIRYRWTPYYGGDGTFGTSDDTTFTFIHDPSNGMYCVVTETPNAYVGVGTPVPRLSARRLQFDALTETGLGETSDAAASIFGEPETVAETEAATADPFREEPDSATISDE